MIYISQLTLFHWNNSFGTQFKIDLIHAHPQFTQYLNAVQKLADIMINTTVIDKSCCGSGYDTSGGNKCDCDSPFSWFCCCIWPWRWKWKVTIDTCVTFAVNLIVSLGKPRNKKNGKKRWQCHNVTNLPGHQNTRKWTIHTWNIDVRPPTFIFVCIFLKKIQFSWNFLGWISNFSHQTK